MKPPGKPSVLAKTKPKVELSPPMLLVSQNTGEKKTGESLSLSPHDRLANGLSDRNVNKQQSLKRSAGAMAEHEALSADVPPKRRRLPGPPVWALRYDGQSLTAAQRAEAAKIAERQKPPQSVPAAQSNKHASSNVSGRSGDLPLSNGAHPPLPPAPTVPGPPSALGSLGPWEVNIENIIPLDEITKTVCDFFFTHVVTSDLPTAAAGAVPSALGQLEVEAKIGKLIHKDVGRRLDLGCCTETVVSKHMPVSFESVMTEQQHAIYNKFLNDNIEKSHRPRRIPIRYKHTYETDTFYELPKHQLASLPPAVRAHMNPNHSVKVRVTTDQKSGALLSKIIKVRLADLSVHSPQTEFDWRISVNLEMNYDGPVDEHVSTSQGTSAPRNKNRMSYRHLEYQIDLTQVKLGPTRGGPESAQGREEQLHELEVEVSGDAVRRTGKAVMDGQSEGFEAVVKGLLDNVRSLVRRFPRESQ